VGQGVDRFAAMVVARLPAGRALHTYSLRRARSDVIAGVAGLRRVVSRCPRKPFSSCACRAIEAIAQCRRPARRSASA